MDRVFSVRMDEDVVRLLTTLARRLRKTKKRILEEAISAYAEQAEHAEQMDVFSRTCGAWRRKKSARRLVADSRSCFHTSLYRNR